MKEPRVMKLGEKLEFSLGNEINHEKTAPEDYIANIRRMAEVVTEDRAKHLDRCEMITIPGIGLIDPPQLVCARCDRGHRELIHKVIP